MEEKKEKLVLLLDALEKQKLQLYESYLGGDLSVTLEISTIHGKIMGALLLAYKLDVISESTYMDLIDRFFGCHN